MITFLCERWDIRRGRQFGSVIRSQQWLNQPPESEAESMHHLIELLNKQAGVIYSKLKNLAESLDFPVTDERVATPNWKASTERISEEKLLAGLK